MTPWARATQFAETKLGDMTPKQREAFGMIFFKELRDQRPLMRPQANYIDRVTRALSSAINQSREVAP